MRLVAAVCGLSLWTGGLALAQSEAAGGAPPRRQLEDVLLLQIVASQPYSHLAGTGAGVGDLDGDGGSEFVLAAATPTLACPEGAIEVRSGYTGAVRLRMCDPSATQRFGSLIVPVGDLDGDGLGEIAVTATGLPGPGSVSIVSAVDGRVHFTWKPGADRDFFGRAVAAVGDTDGDGIADIAVGSDAGDDDSLWGELFGDSTPSVRLYSGRTGEELWQEDGDDDYWFRFGTDLAGVGDVDGDGIPDVAVADTPGAWLVGKPSPSGRVWIVSGRDGDRLHRIDALTETDPFGTCLIGLGDVDGDGRPDLAIASDEAPLGGAPVAEGYVRVVSAHDGRTLYTVDGHAPEDRFGSTLAALPDCNGDGVADFAVGAPQPDWGAWPPPAGYVQVISGRDGAVLAEVGGRRAYGQFGGYVADAGDVDGDCVHDLLVGARGSGMDAGTAYVLSGRELLARP